MNEIVFLVEEAIEGGYKAKAIDKPIITEASSIFELNKRSRYRVK